MTDVRPVRPDDDADTLTSRLGVNPVGDGVIAAVMTPDARAVAALRTLGTPVTPERPAIVVDAADAGPDCEADLVRALLDQAQTRDLDAVSITCDPMDADRLRRLESLGFRPTGAAPYFDIGGGMIEYVQGYTDATGATLDLVWNAPS